MAKAARAAARPAPGRSPAAGRWPAGIDTPKTIGNFYGYATTVFDFTRRSMPFNMPLSLTDNEVYALTAYILVAQQDHRRERRDGRQDPAGR